ncbi:GIY-YIG nuclease family protein [Mesorhizobium sp. BR1-1-7]|uniref:GIY-YIG nuclease family protein n=1 Tax=Mesorhizobium sp. BR1-1-7 TaxID=2876647 RepID=UPI001CCBBFC7|nr:GIY-YIG nuclease family protein [Mesorhizobium sp. BR1-1-7]MBZ9922214.1 GIY-YIG nuclease family protein [Mesorhizobium sp. BR1-1-7]
MRFYEYVYFIKPVGMDGPVKIGCTIDVQKRLRELEKSSPMQLEVAAFVRGGLGLERKLHAYFQASHSHGEWFHRSIALAHLIEKLRNGVAISDAIDLSGVKILRSGVLAASVRELRPDLFEVA